MDATMPWLGLSIKDWLGLSVIGALIAATGSMLGIFVKDFFFARSFEKFKQRQTVATLVQRYHDPLVLAACDMASRLVEILNNYPTVYLKTPFLRLRLNVKKEIVCMIHILELYRQELTFLHPDDYKKSRRLEAAVHKIRAALTDGQLNTSENWDEWRDTLIFREELRAIGESMIETRANSRSIISYCRYCELLESTTPNSVTRWGESTH